MTTRYERAKEIGFQESESSQGLLWWFVSDGEFKIFMDFRVKDDQGNWDGFNPDMPPRMYGADEDDEGNTVWINSSGDTRDRWKEDIKNSWVVKKVERESGLDQDRGQTGLDWFTGGEMSEQQCASCGDTFPVSELEDGLCFGEDTEGCYFDENPAELFRQARRRKNEIRSDRRQEN